MIQILLVIIALIAELPQVNSLGRDPCENYGCQNGGSCMAPYDAPYCVCPDGFNGQYCETASNTDLSSLCSLIDCMPNFTCRPVAVCSNCTPVAQCLPLTSVGEGIDIECNRQRYLQVLLETSDNTSYSQVKCRGPLATRDCPQGSVCVDDLRGGGTCCFGKPDPVEKPGTCPAVEEDSVSICGGNICMEDLECPGEQKCCDHACGSKLCTAPVIVMSSQCPDGCPEGYSCEMRPLPCPVDGMCIQRMVYVCVQITDPCGGCLENQVCIDTGRRCVTTQCPTYQCVENNTCGGCPRGQKCEQVYPPCAPPMCETEDNCIQPECKPINTCVVDTTFTDECGGCPDGQECVSTGIVCTKAPCPSFQCVDKTIDKFVNSCSECSPNEDCIPSGTECFTTPCPSLKCVAKTTTTPTEPPAVCNRQCRKGYTCVLREPPCKKRNCDRGPVPTCVREVPQLASCAKPGHIYNRNSFMCKGEFLNRRCDSDADCDAYRNQRCCPDSCNRRVCTTVPRLN
ncbi:neurogenic locus notch homolog protein 1-like [Physella acuta]|uniref:neurogenic locus notch homolog protein 1-like n=1 Tax=Physella acuta TaxID=109671 RepID=UPI0027DD8E5E|nr:neurogenic locus notch homolog protein 1-like [Physella acuta]